VNESVKARSKLVLEIALVFCGLGAWEVMTMDGGFEANSRFEGGAVLSRSWKTLWKKPSLF